MELNSYFSVRIRCDDNSSCFIVIQGLFHSVLLRKLISLQTEFKIILKYFQPFEMCFRLMNENAQEGEGNNIKAY